MRSSTLNRDTTYCTNRNVYYTPYAPFTIILEDSFNLIWFCEIAVVGIDHSALDFELGRVFRQLIS